MEIQNMQRNELSWFANFTSSVICQERIWICRVFSIIPRFHIKKLGDGKFHPLPSLTYVVFLLLKDL